MVNHITSGSGNADIIFLHGFGGSTKSFEYFANRLNGRYRTTLLDFYGFGHTPPLERAMDIDDYVRSVEELMDAYGMRRVMLVGHSFGGRVAIKLAAKGDTRIKKLVLADSAGILPKRGFSYYVKVYTYKFFKKLHITLNTGSSDYRGLSEVMKQTFVKVVNEDLEPYLEKIKCPTLIVWGENDKDTPPEMGEIMEQKIPNGERVVFLGCGHFAYIEEAGRFLRILEAMMEGE
ncbi:MAG: alpha/beta hydrolase [Clostridiales bacterium]|jgi:pimeloyl-ACP methyl ester carboxylesterase|nr:alpha/beta hydrolase [Clostridiales bacterium]